VKIHCLSPCEIKLHTMTSLKNQLITAKKRKGILFYGGGIPFFPNFYCYLKALSVEVYLHKLCHNQIFKEVILKK